MSVLDVCLQALRTKSLQTQRIVSLRAQRSNPCSKKRLLRRLRLLAMTTTSCHYEQREAIFGFQGLLRLRRLS
jgi:hypothetical protein